MGGTMNDEEWKSMLKDCDVNNDGTVLCILDK